MDLAVARVKTARAALALDSASAVSLADYAEINAARAALSERDAYARTHGETWHLFREEFVKSGQFDPSSRAPRLPCRSNARPPTTKLCDRPSTRPRRRVQTAERFVAAVQAMLANP